MKQNIATIREITKKGVIISHSIVLDSKTLIEETKAKTLIGLIGDEFIWAGYDDLADDLADYDEIVTLQDDKTVEIIITIRR